MTNEAPGRRWATILSDSQALIEVVERFGATTVKR